MTRRVLFAVLAIAMTAHPGAQAVEVLREVRVHGNHTTPDADVLQIAGLALGAPVTDAMIDGAAARLEQSGRFASVEVRKRHRSIADPSEILVIVLVTEVPGITEDDLTPGPWRRLRARGMWLPVLDYEDGYGWTYGARISFIGALGGRSRLSVPLTWGGERRAALEADRTFARGPLTRVEAAASLTRRVNPHFEIADTRREIRGRGERALAGWLRAGAGAHLTHVRFGTEDATVVVPAVDVTVDTRTDPSFPRNAVHAVARLEQLRFDTHSITRRSADVRGYAGLLGSTVLALRVMASQAGEPLPAYEQALLGGASMLRGYRFGHRAGDNLAVMSAELRMPLTSPLALGRFGVKAFIDAGTVYPAGARLRERRLEHGAGGGVFLSWAVLRAGLDVAWPLDEPTRRPRWHFGLGTVF